MGKAVITTDAVGCRDAVEDGITGLLCQPRDAMDLAQKMRLITAMSADARMELGRQGRAKMIREFDERIVTKRYMNTIEPILAMHPGKIGRY